MSTPAAEVLHEVAGQPSGEPGGSVAVGEIAARSPLELFWRRLKGDYVALTALGFIVVLVLVAIFAPLLVKLFGAHPPNAQNPKALDQFGTASGPSGTYLFGTDGLGRDVFSRVLYGARVSLEVAFIATAIGVGLGVVMGMVAGYYRGWVDTLLSRMMDVFLAFPVLLLGFGLGAACSLKGCINVNLVSTGRVIALLGIAGALVTSFWLFVVRPRRDVRYAPPVGGDLFATLSPFLFAGVLGVFLALIVKGHKTLIQPGLSVVIFIIAFASFPYVARIVRGQVLSIREKEFVDAARSLGATNRRIIFREVFPNLVAPIIVYTTLIIPTNIQFEAALSFLGVGIEPPDASWGSMIADATDIFDTAWWFMLFPGLALLLTVLAFNLVGDGLQDALNPRSEK